MAHEPEPATAGSPGSPADETAPAPPAGMQGTLGPLFRLVRDRRVAFLIVGGINTLLGTALFVLYQWAFGQRIGDLGYLAALLGAHLTAIPVAFVLYRRFVFVVRGHVWRDLARFELVNLVPFAVNLFLLPVVVEVLRIAPIPSQLLITTGTVLWNYFGHKHFSFRRAPHERHQTEETSA